MATDGLVGHDAELEALMAFRGDRSGPLRLPAIEGEAGRGKTELARAGVAAGEDLRYKVLAAWPTESEADLPSSVLADLLAFAPDDVFSVLSFSVVTQPS